MRNAAFLILLLLLTGCVDAQLDVHVLPDGSGNVEIDVGYDTRAWPSFLGDPLATYTSRAQLAAWQSPGVVAWSKPEIVKEGRFRRLRTAMWFDSIGDLQFWAMSRGQPLETLGLEWKPDEGRLDLRAGFARFLDDPLPLPTPEQAGMDVSLSPALLDAVRSQIRPVIEGFDVRLHVTMPGEVTRADGFPSIEEGQARLRVDADLLARAMNERAGVIFQEEGLKSQPPRILFTPGAVPKELAARLKAEGAAARRWWNGG